MWSQATAWKLTNFAAESTDEGGLSGYTPYSVQDRGEVFGIILTVLIIAAFVLVYYFRVRKLAPDATPTGYVLVVQLLVMSVRNFVVNLLGKRYEKLTPFFLLLLVYITVANILGIIGVTPPTASLTVTFTLGLMMFFGMVAVAIIHQRQSYVWEFLFSIKVKGKKIPLLINPLAVVGEITPLLSISIRLWGNIFSGFFLVALFYACFDYVFSGIPLPVLAAFLSSIFGGGLSVFLHLYFDVVIGIIQAIVFFMLTVLYWAIRKDAAQEQKVVK